MPQVFYLCSCTISAQTFEKITSLSKFSFYRATKKTQLIVLPIALKTQALHNFLYPPFENS